MHTTVRTIIETFTGLTELTRLAVITRFRFTGAYWRWRWSTALGPGPQPPPIEIARRLIRYGAWCRKMRTGRWG